MKDIILFPAEITYPFFENEIDSILKTCHIRAMFSYGVEQDKALRVMEKHGICADILHIIPHIATSLKDLWINPFDMIKWMCSSSVRSEIISKCSNRNNGIKRFAQILLYGGYALSVEKIVKEKGLATDENISIYSFWMGPSAYAMVYLKEKGYFPNATLNCRAHGGDLYEERGDNVTKYLPFRSYLNEYINKISFISRQGYDYFTSKYPAPNNKSVSYLGTWNKKRIQKSINEKHTICIASCSWMTQIKRIDLIIDALKYMDGINIHWIHLGNGELMEYLRQLSQKKFSGTTVSWEFLGAVPNESILDVYKKYDVDYLINLSDSEGLPVSVMEAYSIGIPAIVRNVGGIGEIVQAETGLLLPEPFDNSHFEIIKKYIQMRLIKPKEYLEISNKCIQVWRKNFDASSTLPDFFQSL